jgi:short subunit dehydrogenase-like uncharacterized protein
MTTKQPKFDVVVYGASSFVGQIIVRYMLQRFPVGKRSGLKWAIAGRSASKLSAVQIEYGAEKIPMLLADAEDEPALRDLMAQTKVVLSTVGPYADYGETLVKVVAEMGKSYVDLTGEPQFVSRMLQRYGEIAANSGARIVHCCGFDSVPSDLGVWYLQSCAREQFGQECTDVKLRVRALKGGMSGGTAASLLNVIKQAAQDQALRRELADPYSLCPKSAARVRQRTPRGATYDRQFKSWTAPFIMAAINTRVVLRSHALKHLTTTTKRTKPTAPAPALKYEEAMLTGRGIAGRIKALGLAIGIAGFGLAAVLPPSRMVLNRLLPAPGEGPSEAEQHAGFYIMRLLGTTVDGQTVSIEVRGDQDPGYGSTAKIISEAAACLALDKLPDLTGFHTPASLLGGALLKRLQAHAGLSFTTLAPD